MKGFVNFLRTTLLGGILFLVPLVAVVFILQKAWVLTQMLVLTLHRGAGFRHDVSVVDRFCS